MEKRKDSKSVFLVVMSVATLIVAGIGATFAYFTATVSDTNNNVTVESYKFATTMSVSETLPSTEAANYSAPKNLIPLNDSDLDSAMAQNCIDDNGYLVCKVYTLSFSNSGDAVDLSGAIKKTTNGFDNLKVKVIDSSDTVISNALSVSKTADTSLQFSTDSSPATSINIAAGSSDAPTEVSYKIVMWLSNQASTAQTSEQGQSFDGTVEFTSTSGATLVGKITAK